ncbi:MAG TPA: response regulator [Chloroflexia bacterium]|jgi:urea transport system substrate-binding protein
MRHRGPILVIDDEPEILQTVATILEFEGYEVERAANGREGLDCIERTHPSLVLLDMRMPVLNGWDFARILKEKGVHLPIVVMTAAQDARRWAQEVGASGYIAKPFDVDDLLTTVGSLVGA